MSVKGGLLSARFELVSDKVHIADPELTTPSGLYVYSWISGVNVKGDIISQFCPSFVCRG